MFLQQHYAANSKLGLGAYLLSGVGRHAAAARSIENWRSEPHGPSRSSLRPPAPVLQR